MAGRCLLYYITDRSQFPGAEADRRQALLDKIGEAARAGVDYIQLREKDLSTRELESLAIEAVKVVREVRTANNEQRTAVLINSRTDVALAVGADGVHLRSDDTSANEARGIWSFCSGYTGAGKTEPVVAVSCHTVAEVLHAETEGADFAVFAPVFEKRDRPEAPPAGLSALHEACRANIPVLALGGVTLQNAASCLAHGAAGIAGIRLFQDNHVEEVVRALKGSG